MKRFICFLSCLFFLASAYAVSPSITSYCVYSGGCIETLDNACVVTNYSYEFESLTGGPREFTCTFHAIDNPSIKAYRTFYAQYTCPSGYDLVDPNRWSNEEPTCKSKCIEGMYWNGTQCLAKPDCPSNSRFDPSSGVCLCASGEPATTYDDGGLFCGLSNKCFSRRGKSVSFSVPIGSAVFGKHDYSKVLDNARKALRMNHCFDGCEVRPTLLETIAYTPPSANPGDTVSFVANFSGNYEKADCFNDEHDFPDVGDDSSDSGGDDSGDGGSDGGESGGGTSGEGGSGGTGDNDSNGEEGGTGDDKPCQWWEPCFNADGPGEGSSDGDDSGESGSGEGGSGGGGSGEGGSGGGGSGSGGSGEGGSGGGGSGGGGSGGGGSGEGGSDEGNSGASSPADGSYSYPTEKIPSSDVFLEFKPDSLFPDGGSCPSDLSFSLLGHSISTDVISKMCYYIEHYVRPIAQLLGTVLALMICAGAFKG